LHPIILVAYHKPDQVERTLRELDATHGKFRYIIVNNSPEPSEMQQIIAAFDKRTERPVEVLRSRSEWFTPALNEALVRAVPSSRVIFYVCSVHTRVHNPCWMRSCLRWMKANRRAGLAGALTRSTGYGNRFDRSNLSFYKRAVAAGLRRRFDYREHFNRRWWKRLSADEKYNLPHVQGGVWAMDRRMIQRIGLPSENFFYSFVDVEYSFRAMSHGWRLGNIPGVWADEGRFDDPIPAGTLISHAQRHAKS